MQELFYPTVTCSFIWEEVWVVLLCILFPYSNPISGHGIMGVSARVGTVGEHPKSSGEKVGQDLTVGMEGKARIMNQEGRGTRPSERAEQLCSLLVGPN